MHRRWLPFAALLCGSWVGEGEGAEANPRPAVASTAGLPSPTAGGCIDNRSWSAPKVAKDCRHGVEVLSRYLQEVREPVCNSISTCCQHFSRTGGATGTDGVTIEDACPWSCHTCGARPTNVTVPQQRDEVVSTHPWPERNRRGCDEHSDTDCPMCTRQHSRYIGAPCVSTAVCNRPPRWNNACHHVPPTRLTRSR